MATSSKAHGPWRLLAPADNEPLEPTIYHARRLLVRGLPGLGAGRLPDPERDVLGSGPLGEIAAAAEDLDVVVSISTVDHAVEPVLDEVVVNASGEEVVLPRDGLSLGDVILHSAVRAWRATDGAGEEEGAPIGRGTLDGVAGTTYGQLADEVCVFTVELTTPPDVDAWDVLERLEDDPKLSSERVGLDHLVRATAGEQTQPYWAAPYWAAPYWAAPYWAAPYWAAPYWAAPDGAARERDGGGSAARLPIAAAWADPYDPGGEDDDRPVVAILDTGLGPHHWFDGGNGVIDWDGRWSGVQAGLVGRDVPDIAGGRRGVLNESLSPVGGHGTFAAGLVRQHCARALLLPVAVIGLDGTGAESTVLQALGLLVLAGEAPVAGEPADATDVPPVDVINLSLGYYHERAQDPAPGQQPDKPLLDVLRAIAALGIAVVASAGNDATNRPFVPAAHGRTIQQETGDDVAPPVAVGALTPDETHVAAFSNDGPWLTAFRRGVAVASTMPTTANGAGGERLRTATGRSTPDPDDFTSGFGVWSGTSFAAPALAGQLARALVDGGVTPRRSRPDVTATLQELRVKTRGVVVGLDGRRPAGSTEPEEHQP